MTLPDPGSGPGLSDESSEGSNDTPHSRDDSAAAGRVEAVRTAARRWREDLLDASGRSRLRHFRDLKTGTLDLTPDSPAGARAAAVDRLLAGKKLRLSDIYPKVSLDAAEPDAAAATRSAPFEDARRRMTAIRKTSLANLEEKGITTCFAAIGLATWSVAQGSAPNAPVILVPLDTAATGAATRDFEICIAGDAHLNPVLAHLLRSEHGIHTDQIDADVAEEAPTSLGDFEHLFDRLITAWSSLAGLAVELRIVISNFSYSTMPLVQDLDNNAEVFAQNDLVAAIAGDPSARESLSAGFCDPSPSQPNVDPPGSEFLILDADSSQHLAINRILGGESVVIQGPPGTGKSQTISNLIGALAAHDKRVLFVAEKRAAIEAVTKRLNAVGLGDLVMDLHGGVTSRRKFASSLADSLDDIAQIAAQDHTKLHRRLQERRDTLLAQKAAVHERREPWDISVFEMRQQLLGVPVEARTELRVSSAAAGQIDRERFERLSEQITEWIDLDGHELPQRYPEWSRSNIETAAQAQAAFERIRELSQQQFASASAAMASCFDDIGIGATAAVATWAEALDSLCDIRDTLDDHQAELYRLDHAGLHLTLAPTRTSRWARTRKRLFSPAYRRARKAVRSTLRSPAALSFAAALDVLERAERDVSAWAAMGAEGTPRVPQELEAALDCWAGASESIAALLDHDILTDEDIGSAPAALADTLDRLASSPDVARRLPRIRELESSLREAEVMSIAAAAGRRFPAQRAVEAVKHAWLSRVLEELSFTDEQLSGFDSDRIGRIREEYASFDAEHRDATPARLRRRIAESVTKAMDAHPEQATLIRAEAGKKRRHLSIRQLLAKASDVLTGLRPGWTMSPVLAAEMIPPDAGIFDEASQIPPAEAMGSLARAPQAVIAGDSRQLPPTTFFGRDFASDDLDADAEETLLALDDIESLLDIANVFLRDTMLTWHYRSRDDRLIAFSNRHIYNGLLTAFPGCTTESPLSHDVVPFRALAGVNGTRSNPDEAVLVADRVLAHAQRFPTQTLGVIAFGQAHADAIEEALRLELRDLNDPALDRFFSDANEERFFVKNIERVQGDERDVIMLSVGYHKDANGKLPYRFGPLNQQGGERRLNVAVTRARSRIVLVSSFSHLDMALGRSKAQGVELLRQYLEYAASGGQVLGAGGSGVALNPFELSVKAGLERRAIPVTPQFGVSGYRIDFACAHPERPGQMVLAVEADGASYHSAPTERDADRLRQQVLEAKGWSFHRIWSTAWFNDQEAELDKAEAAWREAVRRADPVERHLAECPDEHLDGRMDESIDEPLVERIEHVDERVAGHRKTSAVQRKRRPDVPKVGSRGYDNISDYSSSQLVRLAQWIESDTLLRTEHDLMREMMTELGFRRRGQRISLALQTAIKAARA
ncbi:AAA domain-containing protein [Candidatus Poriferisodalis sp.]|uniref:AAA domain-containing protein n=1 Tax=Candidatus Poriferisodalis sp. TaxID=3101277 RepID=UPI003B020913